MWKAGDYWDKINKLLEQNAKHYTNSIVKLALGTGNDKFCFCSVSISDKQEGESVLYNYDEFILLSKFLDMDATNKFLFGVKDGHIDVDDYSVSLRTAPGQTSLKYSFIPSGMSEEYIHAEWPTHYFSAPIPSYRRIVDNEIRQKVNLPPYPTEVQAVIDFMNLFPPIGIFDIPSQFVLTLPDLRARIREMQIIGDNINVQIESDLYRDGELCVKFYCARGVEKRQPSPDIQVFDGKANFRAQFEPDSIDSILMDIKSDQMIDRKSLESWKLRQKGVIISTPESYIDDLIAKGESRTVEFKLNLKPLDEILKTVVSFANTDGGTIIVGVSDQGDIRGFFENKNDSEKAVRGSIASQCEPVIEPKIEWINMSTGPLMIIKVPEGTDKPYILRDRSIYVRKGEDDYVIDRNTLDAIYDMKYGRQFRGYITQE